MKGIQDWILVGEIVLQAKIAQRAGERLQAASDSFDHIETWGSIQSVLAAVANVSKILWPNHKYRERGERLRRLLGVNDDSPLSNRKFRNHFEHYDERIEEYFSTQDSGIYVDLSMNPSLNSIWGDLPPRGNRGYNSFNNTVVFRGETMDLNEVLDALGGLLENCKPYTRV